MEWLPNGVVPCLRRAGGVAVAVRLNYDNAPGPALSLRSERAG